ncbi:MAG: Fic/DOC family N-terminal domain-containing protein [Candidatus Eisenbacteria bacterium]
MTRSTGQLIRSTVAGEEVLAFVPAPLPPLDPRLELDAESRRLLAEAEEGLRRLELAAEMVPSLDWFIYGFVRKEAVVSSQIEGTQATLVDLLAYEAGGSSGNGDRRRRRGLQLPGSVAPCPLRDRPPARSPALPAAPGSDPRAAAARSTGTAEAAGRVR